MVFSHEVIQPMLFYIIFWLAVVSLAAHDDLAFKVLAISTDESGKIKSLIQVFRSRARLNLSLTLFPNKARVPDITNWNLTPTRNTSLRLRHQISDSGTRPVGTVSHFIPQHKSGFSAHSLKRIYTSDSN